MFIRALERKRSPRLVNVAKYESGEYELEYAPHWKGVKCLTNEAK